LEPDEIVITRRSIVALRHLRHIETEFGLQMCRRVVRVSDLIAILGAQLRIFHGYRAIDGDRMAVIIRGVVRQSAQCEGQLIQVLSAAHHASTKSPLRT
jgi:hypothetical protein